MVPVDQVKVVVAPAAILETEAMVRRQQQPPEVRALVVVAVVAELHLMLPHQQHRAAVVAELDYTARAPMEPAVQAATAEVNKVRVRRADRLQVEQELPAATVLQEQLEQADIQVVAAAAAAVLQQQHLSVVLAALVEFELSGV